MVSGKQISLSFSIWYFSCSNFIIFLNFLFFLVWAQVEVHYYCLLDQTHIEYLILLCLVHALWSSVIRYDSLNITAFLICA